MGEVKGDVRSRMGRSLTILSHASVGMGVTGPGARRHTLTEVLIVELEQQNAVYMNINSSMHHLHTTVYHTQAQFSFSLCTMEKVGVAWGQG